jgi:hypothetical protein
VRKAYLRDTEPFVAIRVCISLLMNVLPRLSGSNMVARQLGSIIVEKIRTTNKYNADRKPAGTNRESSKAMKEAKNFWLEWRAGEHKKLHVRTNEDFAEKVIELSPVSKRHPFNLRSVQEVEQSGKTEPKPSQLARWPLY